MDTIKKFGLIFEISPNKKIVLSVEDGIGNHILLNSSIYALGTDPAIPLNTEGRVIEISIPRAKNDPILLVDFDNGVRSMICIENSNFLGIGSEHWIDLPNDPNEREKFLSNLIRENKTKNHLN